MDGWNVHSFTNKLLVLHDAIYLLSQTSSTLKSTFKESELFVTAEIAFLIQNKYNKPILTGMTTVNDDAKSFTENHSHRSAKRYFIINTLVSA